MFKNISLGSKINSTVYKFILALLLLGAGIFIFPNITHAADTYYVNGALGTDDPANGGSIGAGAWETLTYALAAARVKTGDTVYVQEGTYIQGQTNINNTVIGAGDGNPLVIQNYGTDVVTIQTSDGVLPNPEIPSSGLYFINSVDMTFDGINFDNNGVGLGGKYLFGLYSTSVPVNLTIQNATIDGTSGGTIRLFELYGSQAHNLTINKSDISNAGIVIDTNGSSGSNNTINIYSSLIRDSYVALFPRSSSANTVTLKNSLFARFTGYGFYLNAATTTVTAKNNIFVAGGAYDKTTWNLGTGFGAAAISNNAIFDVEYNYYYSEDSPFVATTYGDIMSSTQVVPYIPKQNWFVDPNFTSLGTDYTLAAGSLIAGRGTNDHPADGTDINGVSYGTNDVGPYVNPTLTALTTLASGEVAWHGDSIVAGTGATGESTKAATVFGDYSGDTVTNYGVGGQFTRGLFWAVDASIWTGREASAVIGIGVNDVTGPVAAQTNAQVVNRITTAMQKLDDAGIEPIFVGVHSIAGNPPDNTDVDAISSSVGTTCTSEGWSCGEIVTQMENNVDWKTDYFADLTTNVHPDDDGHAVMARLAEYLYYTKSTMGTDEVDIGAGARLYYDGEFRNIGTASGSTADFTVTPVGGVGSFDSDDKSAYMDITINSWINAGNKEWIASSSTGAGYSQAGSTVYTIGDLAPSSRYQFWLDGSTASSITGSTCSGGICLSDSAGSLTFTYTGGYSSHTFALKRLSSSTSAIADAQETTYEIDVLTPNGGETLAEGDEYEITWESSPESQYYVDISYLSGEEYVEIATNETNDGSYTWTVPADVEDSLIKVVWTDLAEELGSDTSDADFNDTDGETTADDDTDTAEDTDTTDDDETDTDEAIAPSGTGISPVTGEEEEITAVEAGDFISSPSFSTVYYVTESFERRAFISSAVFFTYADSYDEIVEVTDATLTALDLGANMLPNPGVVLVKVQSDAKTYAVDENYDLRWITSEDVAIELYGDDWADYIIDIEATFFASFGAGDDIDSSDDITVTDMKTREEVSQ